MSEMSDMFKLVNQMELAKKARVGTSLTYFDVIELLGEVKSLKSHIDELESARRWRVVADGELPEFGTSILFYDSILEKINKGTCTALDRDKTNLQWITDDGLYYHGNRCEYITHWMNLPTPPEVKQ